VVTVLPTSAVTLVVRVDGRKVGISNNNVPTQRPTLNHVIEPRMLVKNGATDRYSPHKPAMKYAKRGEMINTVAKYNGKHS
jgi:hypothetical protein